MADERIELFQTVVDTILSSPGETSPSERAILAQQPAHLYGLPVQQEIALHPELTTYVAKVATHAYKVVGRDIEQLCAKGYSEDAIFEMTLSIAAGAGQLCLTQGLAALEGVANAPEED